MAGNRKGKANLLFETYYSMVPCYPFFTLCFYDKLDSLAKQLMNNQTRTSQKIQNQKHESRKPTLSGLILFIIFAKNIKILIGSTYFLNTWKDGGLSAIVCLVCPLIIVFLFFRVGGVIFFLIRSVP